MPVQKTRLELVWDALKFKLENMNDPSDSPQSTLWRKVHTGDISSVSNVQAPASSLDLGDTEPTIKLGQCTDYITQFFIHFRFEPIKDVDNFVTYMYYVGLLQQEFLSDHQLGGLAINISNLGHTPAIVSYNDEYPGGVIQLSVTYRTAQDNPYTGP